MLLSILLLACDVETIDNPTGDCEADGDGTHVLHDTLDFTASGSDSDWWVSPLAPDGDLYDAFGLTGT